MIDVDSVHKTYGSVQALTDVSFHIEKGETVGLLGPNGAGKTTLMRILSTYRQPTSGTVSIHGHDTGTRDLEARRHLGYLPESVALYEDMTPERYLRYRGGLKEMSGNRIEERRQNVLDACSLESLRGRPIANLSKGYRKRLGLADALLADPDVLLLDEPTEGLDPNQVRETRELIQSLSQRTTLLLSTHILSDVRAVCDRILIISGGHLRYDGPVEQSPGSPDRYIIRLSVSEESEQLNSDIASLDGVEEVRSTDGGEDDRTLRITASRDVRVQLFHTCVRNKSPIRELTLRSRSLQEQFAEYTEGRST